MTNKQKPANLMPSTFPQINVQWVFGNFPSTILKSKYNIPMTRQRGRNFMKTRRIRSDKYGIIIIITMTRHRHSG